MKKLATLLCCLLLLAGCANIPQESQPAVIPGDKQMPVATDPVAPAQGLDPLSMVRGFIQASALPGNNNASARVYVQDSARAQWKPATGLTIIGDTFSTLYSTDDPQPVDPHERTVVVRGSKLGALGLDNAFIPSTGAYTQVIRVRLQADGQWRIEDPPVSLAITQSDFSANYAPISVPFYSPDSGAFVPDPRYIVAKPQSGLPGRVMDLLMAGPSDGLTGAVRNLLDGQVSMDSNVRTDDDGSLIVPLAGLHDRTVEDKRLIAAQIVLALQGVTNSRIKLLSDGELLLPDHEYWRTSDLPAYNAATAPSSELPGLMTVNGRVRSLGDGSPVPGPVGAGTYNVQSAAQSIDGKRLAVVVKQPDGQVALRVGDLGRDPQLVDLQGGSLTRPTWVPAPAGGAVSGEVWTTLDNTTVIRVVQTANGTWTAGAVNATEVRAVGPITALRLSRDGAHVAAVAGGQIVVAAVVRTSGESVTLRAPKVLQAADLTNVVDADWASQDTLVVATSSATLPVVKVPIDGLRLDAYNRSNLSAPVRGVTAAPSRAVVVADALGLWTASEVGEVWRPQPHTIADADPFYPG